MKLGNTQDVLNKYGKYVVQQSKSNLTKDNKGGGELYNSVKYVLDVESDAFLIAFLMEEYGAYVDKGVKGKTSTYPQTAALSYESMSFLIARSIYNKGLKANLFFTKPFESGIKRFNPDFAKAFALDVENAIILGIKK